MSWPNPAGVPGAKITAITPEGRNVVVLDEPGHFGLKKMIDAAQRKRKPDGAFELAWQAGGVTVNANLKVLASAPAPAAVQAAQPSSGFKRLRLPATITAPAAVPAPAPAPAPAAPATAPAAAPAAPTVSAAVGAVQ
jgi:type VI secretion system protein ImpL